MSQFLFSRVLAPSLAVLSGAALLAAAQDVKPSGEAARLEGFAQSDGTNYFALSLRAPTGPAPRVAARSPRELVVLFSSAASQAAGCRQKALATVAATLAGLRPGDRVKIMAYDLRAVALTDGFVAANGAEASRALAALAERVPLGAADLESALLAAAESYQGAAPAARGILLVGEGASRARAIGPEQFQELVARLASQRAPVLSYGIGPRVERSLLRALAGRTGGVAIEDDPKLTPAALGGMLVSAARVSVYWPVGQASWPAGSEVYPRPLPPLRSDRDTVLLGTMKAGAGGKLELAVEGPAGPQTLVWPLPALRLDEGHAFLRPLVELARIDGGLTLPLLGTASLVELQEELLLGGRDLDALARTALAVNNLDGAEKLVAEALRRDARDPQALAIRRTLTERRTVAGAAASAAAGAGPHLPPPGAANDLDLVGSPAAGSGNGALVELEGQRISVAEQAAQIEVQTVIGQARGSMATEPEQTLALLRQELARVRQMPEPRPEVRGQLLDQLRAALRAVAARKTAYENQRRQLQEINAAAQERMLTERAAQRDQQTVKQLLERFDYLVHEGKYRQAEEDTACEAIHVVNSRMDRPNNPQVVAAVLSARAGGALDNQRALRLAQQKGFVDTMWQVEQSHVPTPDVPAIVYPDGQIWRELSARRLDKYRDAAYRGPAEKKLDEALKSPTAIEFVQTPLGDVIDYLRDLHRIEIQLDKRELDSMGLGPDTLVTISLKGISLRSALRLLLDDLGLKFVVHDEMLLVTSPTKADNDFLTTKAYQMGDLAVPIRPPVFTGGFGPLGGPQGNNLLNRNTGNPQMAPGMNPFGNQGMNPFGNQGVNQNPAMFNIPGNRF
jgi:hypothetical protein